MKGMQDLTGQVAVSLEALVLNAGFVRVLCFLCIPWFTSPHLTSQWQRLALKFFFGALRLQARRA
jgi:hypothetical protein